MLNEGPMRNIDINDLPQWSPWPARLLGLEEFKQPKRDIDKIEQEYNQDKFATCLELYNKSGGTLDPLALRFSIGADDLEQECNGVVDGELVIASERELIDALFRLLPAALADHTRESNTILEMGTAFGANLWKLSELIPGKQYVGADYSENAIQLAKLLYADRSDIRVEKFNFYDERYPVLSEIDAPVTVFTSQAIEQLPSAVPFVDALTRDRDKIAAVVHLEPAYGLHDDSLMGLLRRRYLEINDYNRDLLSELERRPGIDILDVKKDVMGFNAYNSLSLITWKFKS